MELSKEYFDEIADQWDTMQNSFFDTNVRLKAYDLAAIEKGKTAADIGAGTGFITEGLLEAEVNVIAVDQSDKMLQLLQKKFHGKGNLNYVNCDGHAIEIEDETCDYVFANMYLHHTVEPYLAIREMHRILKKGGKLVTTDLDQHGYEFLKTEQHDVWLGFEREQITKWFLEAGFDKVTMHCVGSNCCAESNCNSDYAQISIFAALGEK